jgi:hypothetical protein
MPNDPTTQLPSLDQLTLADLTDEPNLPSLDELTAADLTDTPQGLPSLESLRPEDLTDQPPSEYEKRTVPAFPVPRSELYQAPLPLPGEEPPPKEPPKPMEFGAGYMGMPVPVFTPGAKPYEGAKVAGQIGIGGLQIAPSVSKGGNLSLAWLARMGQNIAKGISEQQVEGYRAPGAWAPPLTKGQAEQAKKTWASISDKFVPAAKWFEDVANIPGEYEKSLDIIGDAMGGPAEIRQITKSFGSAIPSLAVGGLGFPAMVAMAGLQQAGDTYGQSVEARMAAGQDEESARRMATGDGLVSGIITAVVTGAFGRTGKEAITAAKGNVITKGVLMRLAKEAGFEGGEEMVDQLLQTVYEWQTYNPDITLEEAIKEVLMAGVAGFAIGGAVSGTIETSQAIDERTKNRKELKDFREQIRKLVEHGPEAQYVPIDIKDFGVARYLPPEERTKSPFKTVGAANLPVQPSPVRGRATPILPEIAGTEGAAVVNQAMSVGLPNVANEIAKGVAIQPPLNLEYGREAGIASPPIETLRGRELAARQVAEGMPVGFPLQGWGGITPPAAAAAPAAQPTPAEAAGPTAAPEAAGTAAMRASQAAVEPGVAAPSVATAPAVEEAPIAPQVATAPEGAVEPGATAPAPTPAPAPAAQVATAPAVTEEAIGLRTNLERDFPHIRQLVEVVDNPSQLPQEVLDDLARKGTKLEDVDAVYHNGKVIFNSKNFPVGDRSLVQEKISHEVGIHLGLRAALGPAGFTNLVRSIWTTLSPNDRAQIAARNNIDPDNIFEIGEEWLAYEAERVTRTGVTNNLWRRIANVIRRNLRRIPGFRRTTYTDFEIAEMIQKGMRKAEALSAGPEGTMARASLTGEYPPGSPLATINTIRYSYADVRRARLDGLREYTPEVEGADLENAFEHVKEILYIEAETLSDLIPPRTKWFQPTKDQSLIEYIRKFYSPEGIALIRKTLERDAPPAWVENKKTWWMFKAELNNVYEDRDNPRSSLGRNFLAMNRKTGGVSWDFGLGTCMPTSHCIVCYAQGMQNPTVGSRARVRHSIVTALEPEAVGGLVARYIKSRPKGDQSFLRVNGAGDTTFEWQARAVNEAIKNLDRPVHIFSRSHVSRAPGTVGLDSISNGWFNPADIENGVAVFKMGSIDRQLYREYVEKYGIEFLKNNLEERGIINSYLVKDAEDIPHLLELKKAGVFMVMHIDRSAELVEALYDAGLIANKKNPEMNTPACFCALKSGPFLNGCATCLVAGGPCFAWGSGLGMTPDGKHVLLERILSGKEEPPEGPIVELARIGIPKNRDDFLLQVVARSYEMAGSQLHGRVRAWESGKLQKVRVENPRTREILYFASNKKEVKQASKVADQYLAEAKRLRGLYERFKNAPAKKRLIAKYEFEQAIALEKSMTEGVAAMERAIRNRNVRYSMTSGQPRATPESISEMDPAGFAVWSRGIPDGITGEAVRLGRTITTAEQLQQLQQFQAQAKTESSQLMQAGDFDGAMAAATKGQFFREAYEVATGTGSMAYAMETGRVNEGSAFAQPHDISEEGPPPEPAPGVQDVSDPEFNKEYRSRYSISRRPDPNGDFVPIHNAAMDASLARYGLPPHQEALGKPDSELLRQVQMRMARDPTWVDSIVDREKVKPGLLSDEEVMALGYWGLQLRTEIDTAARKAEEAEAQGLQADAAGYRRQVDFWAAALTDLREITVRSGTESGRAFRARQLAIKWDFTLDSMYYERRRVQGWRRLSDDEKAELRRELEKKARAFTDNENALEVARAKESQKAADKEISDAKAEVATYNPAVIQFAEDWIREYEGSAQKAKDRLKVKWARFFPDVSLRLSAAGGARVLPPELLNDLGIIGGAKLSRVDNREDWNTAMRNELGAGIGPYLDQVWDAAQANLTDRIERGRADFRAMKASQPPARRGAKAKQTPAQEVEVAKAKIHQIAEHEKTSAEPVKSKQDELYHPVQRLIRAMIEEDPLMTREDLISAVQAVLEPDYPGITIGETMDLISGRGRVRRPSQDETSKTVRDLKAQIRILSNIADTEAHLPLPKTGWLADEKSDEQRRLEYKLNRTKKIEGEVVVSGEHQRKTYLDTRKTWYRNRIADLRWEMENNRLIREKQSPDIKRQTDAEFEALREEYDKVREEHAAIFEAPDLTDAERIERAERAADRIIAKMEDDLANKRRTAAGKKDPLTSAKLEAQRLRIVQLRAEQEWAIRELNPPPDLSKKEDYHRWFQLDREIRKLQQQLASQDVFKKSKTIKPEATETTKRMAEQLEELRKQRKEMRDRLGPGKPDPVTKAINFRIAHLQRQIADYAQRLADRDFEPRKRKEPPQAVLTNPTVVALEAKRNQMRKDWYNEQQAEYIRNLKGMKWVGYNIQRTRQAITNLRSSYDFSGARQGLVALMSLSTRLPWHPIKTTPRIARAFGQMFQAAFSKTKAEQIQAAIRQKPNWESGAYKIMGIEFTDIESPMFTRMEENARSVFDEWAAMGVFGGKTLWGKVAGAPFRLAAIPVAQSNRAFSTFLNVLRSELADALLEENFSDRLPTQNELQILGHYVNVATGRGSINPKLASGMGQFLWAPKLLASRIQFLSGQPLWGAGEWKASGRARKIIAKEYARVLGSAALLFLVSRLFDEKKEESTLSSDAGKIVRGNTRIDLWGGFMQPIVLFSRLWTNQTKTLKGRTIDFASADAYGVGNLMDVLVRFGRGKLRPDMGVALDVVTREDFLGRPTNIPNVMRDLLVPLPFADIVQIYKDRGVPEGTILTILNLFGAGVNTYTDDNKYPRETRTS